MEEAIRGYPSSWWREVCVGGTNGPSMEFSENQNEAAKYLYSKGIYRTDNHIVFKQNGFSCNIR